MLHICIPLFNPTSCVSRYENIIKTIQNINLQKSIIYVVELCYGTQRSGFYYSHQNVKHLLFQTDTILWHKENLINLCLSQLPEGWNYFAWIDGDILFNNDLWIESTINLLDKNDILQLFSSCCFLNKQEKIDKTQIGFVNSIFNKTKDSGHCGYAWAINKNCYEKIGGLFENAIIGGGDKWITAAFIQRMDEDWLKLQPDNLIKNFKKYYSKCKNLKLNYINQQIFHLYHGELNNRNYYKRHLVLKEAEFDPERHLYKNKNGILDATKFFPNSLKKHIVDYFKSRNDI